MVVENDDLFFGQIVPSDDIIISTLKNDLHIYPQLSMCPTKMENLIVWWVNHELCNFPMLISSFVKSLALWDHKSK